jgi:hypothetical protein
VPLSLLFAFTYSSVNVVKSASLPDTPHGNSHLLLALGRAGRRHHGKALTIESWPALPKYAREASTLST